MSEIELMRCAKYLIDPKCEVPKLKREYIICAPDKLKLEGDTWPPVLVRNGDEYYLTSHAVYDGSDLFIKEEAEKALKELGLDWELSFLQVVVKE